MKRLTTYWPTIKQTILAYRFPGLSAIFLLLANMAFGFFLHELDTHEVGWAIAIVYIIVQCSALSICWKAARNFVLKGFTSDVGYAFLAVAGASFAVVIVAWFQIATYFLTMLAAAILLRIKLYTRHGSAVGSFVIMLVVSFAGLAISWIPTWMQSSLP